MTSATTKTFPRTTYEAALVLAVIAQRSKNRFCRFGRNTLLKASGRKKLAPQILDSIAAELYELGYEVIRLGTSWVLLQTSAVESAARSVTGKRWLTSDERDALTRGLPLDVEAIEAELDGLAEDNSNNEDDEV